MQASIYADVIGSRRLDDPTTLLPTLGETVRRLNHLFAPSIATPFAVAYDDAILGALADPVQAPLCLSVMRELLAPLMVRVGVALDGSGEDAFTIAWHEDRLVHYSGMGEAGDLLLNALWRLLDPLLRQRTPAQWQAAAAVRRHETRGAAAAELGITERALAGRLEAGHWRTIEDVDATVAAYLAIALGGGD
jgi:hypothetical protein